MGKLLAMGATVAAAAMPLARPVHAEDVDPASRAERCATRLSIAILGKGASPELLADRDPQSKVDGMLQDPLFVERFAGFLNSQFNKHQGNAILEDAPYFVAKHVLEKKLQYRDLFLGPFNVVADGPSAKVVDEPGGLGFFRVDAWLRRYAGNEADGYKIVTAYRMMQNTVGLSLVATTNDPSVDLSSKGRTAPACAGCHETGWFALDRAAKVLSRRVGTGPEMTFAPPTEGPQQVADATVANDEQFVRALVASENFDFRACRLAFEFLHGRAENACEANIFEACFKAFRDSGQIQAGIAAIAKDASYC